MRRRACMFGCVDAPGRESVIDSAVSRLMWFNPVADVAAVIYVQIAFREKINNHHKCILFYNKYKYMYKNGNRVKKRQSKICMYVRQ